MAGVRTQSQMEKVFVQTLHTPTPETQNLCSISSICNQLHTSKGKGNFQHEYHVYSRNISLGKIFGKAGGSVILPPDLFTDPTVVIN